MNNKTSLVKKPSLLNLVLFIALPFVSFILSLRNLKSKTNTLIFILFCVLYGYAFVFQYTKADSYSVAAVFTNFDFKSLVDIYQLYLLGDTPDIYKFLSYAFIKNFTTNPKILFAFYGLVFGIFWYLSLRVFLKEKASNKDMYIHILFIIFVISNPISSINGARFNTAIWIFFYGAMYFLFYNKKRYLILLLCTPLVHFSFIFPVFIVFFFFMIKKFLFTDYKINRFLFYIFIFTFCVSWILETNIINLDAVSNIIPSDSISRKIDLYNSDETTDSLVKKTSGSIFLKAQNISIVLLKIYFFFFVIFGWNTLKKIKSPTPQLNKLFAFILFFLSFGFVASSLPSGIRFLMISFLFCIIFMLKLYLAKPSKLNKNFILLLLPVYSFKIVSLLYFNYLLVSSTIWYGNTFWIIYEGIGFKFVGV